jgi:hypothetical protein
MQIGLQTTLSWREEREEPFTLTSATVALLKPDGTPVGSPPTVTIESQYGGLVALLTAPFTPSQAGLYVVTWSLVTASGTTQRQQRIWSTFSDVNGTSAQRVTGPGSRFDEGAFGLELGAALNGIYRQYPSLLAAGGYSALSASDGVYMDDALAWLLTARMQAVMAAGESPASARGVLTRRTAGDETEIYSDKHDDFVATCIEAAAKAITSVSYVALALSELAGAGLPIFAIGGGAFSSDPRGANQPLIAQMGRLLQEWS